MRESKLRPAWGLEETWRSRGYLGLKYRVPVPVPGIEVDFKALLDRFTATAWLALLASATGPYSRKS